jgi:hypothetical protein
MTSPIRASDVLKQDTRGRVLVSAARREALLDEFERSGSSAMRFARLAGLKYSTFANWVQARRRKRALAKLPGGEGRDDEASAARDGSVRLFEALVEDGSDKCQDERGTHGVRIELPGGCWLSVGSPAELPLAAELVALIAQAVRVRC